MSTTDTTPTPTTTPRPQLRENERARTHPRLTRTRNLPSKISPPRAYSASLLGRARNHGGGNAARLGARLEGWVGGKERGWEVERKDQHAKPTSKPQATPGRIEKIPFHHLTLTTSTLHRYLQKKFPEDCVMEGAAAPAAPAETPAEPAEEAKGADEDDYSATEDEVRSTVQCLPDRARYHGGGGRNAHHVFLHLLFRAPHLGRVAPHRARERTHPSGRRPPDCRTAVSGRRSAVDSGRCTSLCGYSRALST